MRIWSIHPAYLDSKRLGAQWREGLLCRYVMNGLTKGYKNHPQFLRFRDKVKSDFLDTYLYYIWLESKSRGFNYNINLLNDINENNNYCFPVTLSQVQYEIKHLYYKLCIKRDVPSDIKIHPCFHIVDGPIEWWERPRGYS